MLGKCFLYDNGRQCVLLLLLYNDSLRFHYIFNARGLDGRFWYACDIMMV